MYLEILLHIEKEREIKRSALTICGKPPDFIWFYPKLDYESTFEKSIF